MWGVQTLTWLCGASQKRLRLQIIANPCLNQNFTLFPHLNILIYTVKMFETTKVWLGENFYQNILFFLQWSYLVPLYNIPNGQNASMHHGQTGTP